MNFTIQIDDAQRLLLIEAVTLLMKTKNIAPDAVDDELELMNALLIDLPDVERKDPGCVHGFCY